MSYAERLKPGFARASSSWRSAALSPPGASSPPAFHGSDTLRFRWRPSGAVRAAMSHPGACTSPSSVGRWRMTRAAGFQPVAP